MKKVTTLQANTSRGKYFVSADRLNNLYRSGIINRETVKERHGLHWTISTYKYTTIYGVVLATINKDSTCGFCSQAFGVEIPVDTLKNPILCKAEYDIWERDMAIFRKHKVIAKIAFIERGKEAFY